MTLDKNYLINDVFVVNLQQLVVGGDGTVNKALPYLVNTTKTLGIIPCGTANLLASKLGINSISKALKVIDKENIRKIKGNRSRYCNSSKRR